MKYSPTISYVDKHTGEVFSVTESFSTDVSGTTIASCTATCYDSSNIDVTSSMIDTVASSGSNVTFNIKNGTGGETYQVKVVVRTPGNRVYTHYVRCEVFDSLTLNTKLGDFTANSYVTLKEANDYIRNKYGHTSTWDEITDDAKKRLLVEACNIIDRFNFIGEKYYDSQPRSFPRDDHSIITGNCATFQAESTATLLGSTSFYNSGLADTSYNTYPNNYWKYGTCHLTATYQVQTIASSNKNGIVHMDSAFTASLTTSTEFTIFKPVYDEVKHAQIEQALYIAGNSAIGDVTSYSTAGVQKIKIGNAELWFKGNLGLKDSTNPTVKRLLSKFLKKQLEIQRK